MSIYSSGYEPAERSAVKMNPVTSHRQGGDVKSTESTLEWMVKSNNYISSCSMGLFIIAVLANNFFQFGTNYRALFLFIIFTSSLLIYYKGMSCPSWQWHRTGYHWLPVQILLVAPFWCDLGRCSRTVVVIKLQ